MRRIATLLSALVVSGLCHAQVWYEVGRGTFMPSEQHLTRVRATLKDAVAAAMAPKTERLRDWASYLIQYRGTTIEGKRAIEIHGSCSYETGHFDPKSEFYDERVFDGGTCFFVVYFLIDSGKYTKVVFHGYA